MSFPQTGFLSSVLNFPWHAWMPQPGGSAEGRCWALVEGALLFNPCWDEVSVLAAGPNLASPGCCRDSDTARGHCCFSESHRSGDTSCTTTRGTSLSPALHPWDHCFSLLGFSWLLCKAWVFSLKMAMPEGTSFHQCSTIHLKTKPLKTEGLS